MATNNEIKRQLDFISRTTGLGSLSSAYANMLYGINHRGAGNPVAGNTDLHGLTFFTRPDLNLTYDNAAMSRMLMPLLTDGKDTLQRYVRAILDPESNRQRGIDSPLVDPKSPFIPLLTNNLMSISGFPDFTVDTYTSPEGIYKEAWSMVDSVPRIYSTYDITANFRNIMGDPITLLFLAWCHYATMVYEGSMVPYIDNIIENRIDYQSRIYRVVLDRTKTYVQKIAATGACFPMASPLGAAFNYSFDEPINRENDQISIPFRCMGIDYQDPVLIEEFNGVVVQFNKAMADGARSSTYRKMTVAEREVYNYNGYPRIDPTTYELEWWIPINQEDLGRDPEINFFSQG